MTTKIYRTAQGRSVDIGAILNQQENTRSVGNMNVNARGDRLNSANKSISSKSQQVNKQYRKQTSRSNVSDTPVYASRAHAESIQEQYTLHEAEVIEDVAVVEVVVEASIPAEPAPSIGLAAALAKARQIKQEPLKTSRQVAQECSGVKRI